MILSAQATDKSVNIATRELYKHANTPQAILALGVDGLSRYIKTIGLFNTKAKNVIATCRILVEQHGGQVPESREALEALPGVGRKTANVILNTAFGQPTIAVDTHIFRVSNRTGLAPGDNVRTVEDHLVKVVPPGVRARRASLADPARPLHLHRAQTEVPGVRDPRSVRVTRTKTPPESKPVRSAASSHKSPRLAKKVSKKRVRV